MANALQLSSSSMAGRSSAPPAGNPLGNLGNPPENLRIVFFLPMLDNLGANDWYFQPGMVPLIPRQLGELTAAYFQPLHLIIGSPLNQAGKVQNVYVHLGCGGLFEINPNSSAFRDCTEHRFEVLLRKLLENRQLVEPGSNVIIAREIKTTQEVRAIYRDLRENYYKIGCVSGGYADNARAWANLVNEIAGHGHHSLMFLFGNHVGFMRRERLVDTFLKVSGYDLEHNSCVSRVTTLIEQQFGIM